MQTTNQPTPTQAAYAALVKAQAKAKGAMQLYISCQGYGNSAQVITKLQAVNAAYAAWAATIKI